MLIKPTGGTVLFNRFGQPIQQEEPDSSAEDLGKNVPNSVADVSVSPPADWEARLRAISPKTTVHSWLQFYWYRYGARWVIYDCLPRELIDPDTPVDVGLMGRDFLKAVDGPPPRELTMAQRSAWVSDAQHEMHRLHRVYARPLWVLQGDTGGHQVRFDPEQVRYLTEVGKPTSPPRIGELPPCPFDSRVIQQLERLSRLKQLGSLDAMKKAALPEAYEAQVAERDRQMRAEAIGLLEQQMSELGDMAKMYGGRKDTSDYFQSATGKAAKASEALAAYVETGQFIQ